MPQHPLFYSLAPETDAASVHDQLQLALAIATPDALKSLLVNCIPAIAQWHQIGAITTDVVVPVGEQFAADGIVRFDAIQCVLSESGPPIELAPLSSGRPRESRELARLTQYESELHTLGRNLRLAPIVSLLAESGFYPHQIESILNLPQDGWFKSWWFAIDQAGDYSLPFLRHLRTLHYPDGTFAIQYRDFFEQDKPSCFTSLPSRVLLAVRPDGQSFGETLRQVNVQRQQLDIIHTILICNTLSELEAQGFINQGVHVYPLAELVRPLQANCVHCGRKECAMNGAQETPIALCYGYLPAAEFV